MILEPLDLSSLSDIKVQFALAKSPARPHADYLVVQFSGHYRGGSSGQHDARFLRAMTAAGLEAFPSDGIVFDCRVLSYHDGDDIETVFDSAYSARGGGRLPSAIVIGPNCASGLRHALGDGDPDAPLTDEDDIFNSFEAALAYIDKQNHDAKPRSGLL